MYLPDCSKCFVQGYICHEYCLIFILQLIIWRIDFQPYSKLFLIYINSMLYVYIYLHMYVYLHVCVYKYISVRGFLPWKYHIPVLSRTCRWGFCCLRRSGTSAWCWSLATTVSLLPLHPHPLSHPVNLPFWTGKLSPAAPPLCTHEHWAPAHPQGTLLGYVLLGISVNLPN